MSSYSTVTLTATTALHQDLRAEMRGGISLTRIARVTLYGNAGTKMKLDLGDRMLLLEAESSEELEEWVEALTVNPVHAYYPKPFCGSI